MCVSVCVSETLMLYISETKRFRGSRLIGTLYESAYDASTVTSSMTSCDYDGILVTSQSSNSETGTVYSIFAEPLSTRSNVVSL